MQYNLLSLILKVPVAVLGVWEECIYM
jgi:hypothetical protein